MTEVVATPAAIPTDATTLLAAALKLPREDHAKIAEELSACKDFPMP